ncbi:hypothetical protein ROZALSC1DRAFT_26050 [Rozella allomycis CSF55]|uniref:Uncharacterized protein n=1 Tax=Rozella allomycis (strain CSF55) TaxID=988480 RepID=A0A4P9YA68_ROZAC|nr:hypothetical protein ROZALSC1DRAFT_26050 [Rozella allomycis CSF55]
MSEIPYPIALDALDNWLESYDAKTSALNWSDDEKASQIIFFLNGDCIGLLRMAVDDPEFSRKILPSHLLDKFISGLRDSYVRTKILESGCKSLDEALIKAENCERAMLVEEKDVGNYVVSVKKNYVVIIVIKMAIQDILVQILKEALIARLVIMIEIIPLRLTRIASLIE